jgi:tetratricopeptide (TPR) repeat protein
MATPSSHQTPAAITCRPGGSICRPTGTSKSLSTAPVTPSAPVERRPQRAEVLLDQARAGLRDPSLRAEAVRLDGRVRVPLARPPEAPALLLEAAHAFEPIDSNRARWALLEALDAGVVSLSFTTGTTLEDIARAVLAVPREAEGPPALVDLLLDGTATLLASDYATAVPILREATAVLRSGAVSREDVATWFNLGLVIANELCDDETYGTWVDLVEQRARDEGALIALQVALIGRAKAETRAGQFDAAEATFDEAVDITRAIGGVAAFYELLKADLHAWRGDEAATETAAASLHEGGAAIGSGPAVGIAHLARGDAGSRHRSLRGGVDLGAASHRRVPPGMDLPGTFDHRRGRRARRAGRPGPGVARSAGRARRRHRHPVGPRSARPIPCAPRPRRGRRDPLPAGACRARTDIRRDGDRPHAPRLRRVAAPAEPPRGCASHTRHRARDVLVDGRRRIRTACRRRARGDRREGPPPFDRVSGRPHPPGVPGGAAGVVRGDELRDRCSSVSSARTRSTTTSARCTGSWASRRGATWRRHCETRAGRSLAEPRTRGGSPRVVERRAERPPDYAWHGMPPAVRGRTLQGQFSLVGRTAHQRTRKEPS